MASIFSAIGNFFGDKSEKKARDKVAAPEFALTPTYPEADEARQSIAAKLKDFGNQPGYGAIAPNWADIWDLAKQRVSQYYSGTATSPGLNNKIKASAARRGVQDSPALENMLLRSGVEEGGQLSNLAKEQGIAEAGFAETGRRNWLSDSFRLSDMKPGFQSYNMNPDLSVSNLMRNAGGIADSLNPFSWLDSLLRKVKGTGKTQSQILGMDTSVYR